MSRACLRKPISKDRKQPLILLADNGIAMRAATFESRLEELGVLRSFSFPMVLNENPYSESLFLTVKYRPYYLRKPFAKSVPRSIRQPAERIQRAGADTPAAGVNPASAWIDKPISEPNPILELPLRLASRVAAEV